MRHSLQGLVIAAVAAFALDPGPAAAVTQLNSCADLTTAGETYVLTANVSDSPSGRGACFRILADRITLDLGGHTVTGLGTDGGVCVWDGGGSRVNTVIRNGVLTDCGWGTLLRVSTRTTVRNITAVHNFNGIEIGSDSLVKDCVAQRNLNNGIQSGDRGQVENCVVGDAVPGVGVDGNGNFGIVGGDRMLVTRTKANGNANAGIRVGENSTVTHNTVAENGIGGIVAGARSLVTNNTANNNGANGITVGERSTVNYNTVADSSDDGIEAVCPSTIMYNEVGPSGAENIHTIGAGCVVKNNLLTANPGP